MTAIDLFAGLGGWTEGATQAGLRVLWAANHWPLAVEIHRRNHGATQHDIQDLQQADWSLVPRHDVGLASPACQGHTRARGIERPHHDACRSTAWAVVSCAEYHRSPYFLIENVPEFYTWELYPAWKSAMEAIGYTLAEHIIDFADLGVPQHRVRAIIVCTRTRAPLQLKLERQDHVPARAILDLGAGRFSPVATKVPSTRRKVAIGRRKFGREFLVAYYGNEDSSPRSLNNPIGTITTRDRHAIVLGNRMRMISIEEARRAMSFRADYQLPANHRAALHLLGNAVPPLGAEIILNALKRAA